MPLPPIRNPRPRTDSPGRSGATATASATAVRDLLRSSRRILAVGDSLTAGFQVARADRYPAILARELGVTVRNAGVSGEISAALLRRLPALLRGECFDTVLLCTGGNDLLRGLPARQLQTHLEQAITRIRDSGATPVLMAVPLIPFAPVDHPVYRQVATATKTGLVEGFGHLLHREHFQTDGVHPNAAGYRRIVTHLLAN